MLDEAEEAGKYVFPDRKRLGDVTRVEMWGREGAFLNKILSERYEYCPPERSARGDLSDPEKCILEVYEYFLNRIQELGKHKALKLLDCCNHLYVILAIPSDAMIARNIVMAQGKGKPLEPNDIFKGFVCFSSIKDEDRQNETLAKWNSLTKAVGRATNESACLFLAQAEMVEVARMNGEVDLMERYLRKYTVEHNIDGVAFFDTKVFPASILLNNFRNGLVDLLSKGKEAPSLEFLRAATLIAVSKEVEMVVLQLLLLCKNATDKDGRAKIEKQLRKLERIALWMMLTTPKPQVRRKRCFAIMQELNKNDLSGPGSALELSEEEKRSILEALDSFQFGEIGLGCKAKAVLGRLNEYKCATLNQEPTASKQVVLEHILPKKYDKNCIHGWKAIWGQEEASDWMHRLGNLALLGTRAKSSDASFYEKKHRYLNSPFPLTQQLHELPHWDFSAVRLRHTELNHLAANVWDLYESEWER